MKKSAIYLKWKAPTALRADSICDDKKIKRLIDHEKGNIYDVSDSDQSLSDDDDHG